MRPTYFRILVLIILPILFYFHFRGLAFGEEGYLLNSASKLLNGSVPYRDFYFTYNPLGIFVTSFAFLLFGESVFAARILTFTLSIFSIWIIFNTVKKVTKRLMYSLLSVLVFIAWGPTHVNFTSPIAIALPIVLLIIYLILLSESKRNRLTHFLIGILSFIAFLAFQNFIVILLPVIIHFLISESNKNNLLKIIYGFVWGIIAFIIYLLFTNSFASYLNNLGTFSIVPFQIDSFTFSSSGIFDIFIFLTLPISSLLTLTILIYRRKYNLVYIPLVILSCFLALLSSSNKEGLYPVLSLAGVTIVIFINKLPTLTIKLFSYIAIYLLIATGFYTALVGSYYNSNIPLVEQNSYVGGKISLFVDRSFMLQHQELKDLIAHETKPDDYIYINSFSPLTYFIYDRKNPVPFDHFESMNDAYYEDLVIHSLVGKDVGFVILDESWPKDEIEKFVTKKYKIKRKIGQYSVYLEP